MEGYQGWRDTRDEKRVGVCVCVGGGLGGGGEGGGWGGRRREGGGGVGGGGGRGRGVEVRVRYISRCGWGMARAGGFMLTGAWRLHNWEKQQINST